MAPRWPGPKPTVGSDPLESLFDNLIGNLIRSIVRAVLGIFIPGSSGGGGIPSGVNPLAWLSDLMGLRWAQVDAIHDGQLDLNDRIDLLSPLQDYGSSYAGTQNSLWNKGKIPFDKQIGPMRNCHMASGGIVLDDQGLWDVRGRIWITAAPPFVGGYVTWEIRVVKDSDGSIFSFTRDEFESAGSQAREINTCVVIPSAAYRAEVHVLNIGPGRQIAGGPAVTRLTVQHITRSTTNPI